MSFGRRLAIFFVLIALVPTLALLGMLAIVSEDSRRGKADARLAAGLDTVVALYDERVADARSVAEPLVASPELGSAVTADDQPALRRFAERAIDRPGVTAVTVTGPAGADLAAAGADDAVAFADTRLTSGGAPIGALLVSTTVGPEFASEVRRLTKRDVVITREGAPLTATVSPPEEAIEPGRTVDVEVGEAEYRAHQLALDEGTGESLLLLGPRKEGGFFTVDRPAAVLLLGILALGVVLAYALARTLTGLHARVSAQAITDSLTGLWNRRRMEELLNQEVNRAKRFGHKVSFLIVDIDDFKKINDDLGHTQGDAVLRRVAEIVLESTRTIDLGARYGGDELALILVETGTEGAKVVAERLRAAVSEERVPLREGGSMQVTVSIGIATVPDSAEDVDDLVESSDQALLRAKRTGKDKTRIAPRRRVPAEAKSR